MIKEKLKSEAKKCLKNILNCIFSIKMSVIGIPLLITLLLTLNKTSAHFSSIINNILFSNPSNINGTGNVSAIAVVIWTAAFALVILYIQILDRKQLGIPVIDIIKVRLGGLFWFHLAVAVFALEIGMLLIGVSRNSMLLTTLLTFAQIYNLVIIYWNLIIMTTVVHVEEIIDKSGEMFVHKLCDKSYSERDLKKDWPQNLIYKLIRGINLKDLYYSDIAIDCIIRFLEQAESAHSKGGIHTYCVNAIIFYMIRAIYETHPEKDVPQTFVRDLFIELRRRSLNDSDVEEGFGTISAGWRLILWYIVKEQQNFTYAKELAMCNIPGLTNTNAEMRDRIEWLALVEKNNKGVYRGDEFFSILYSFDIKLEECEQNQYIWSTLCKSY